MAVKFEQIWKNFNSIEGSRSDEGENRFGLHKDRTRRFYGPYVDIRYTSKSTFEYDGHQILLVSLNYNRMSWEVCVLLEAGIFLCVFSFRIHSSVNIIGVTRLVTSGSLLTISKQKFSTHCSDL